MDAEFTQHQKNIELPYDFNPLKPETFDPNVWGPHFWFFLHTIVHTYPETPNAVSKRKYYDFIQNLPLFIPNPEIGNMFITYLDKYPVSPYLDNRDSFIRWVHFIHNKMNLYLGKPELTLYEGLDHYFAHYKPKPISVAEHYQIRKEYIVACFTVLLLIFIIIYYR
jgi:hypothetical protein